MVVVVVVVVIVVVVTGGHDWTVIENNTSEVLNGFSLRCPTLAVPVTLSSERYSSDVELLEDGDHQSFINISEFTHAQVIPRYHHQHNDVIDGMSHK